MNKFSRNIVVLTGVVFCAVFLAGISLAETKRMAAQEQVENPYKDSRVLVEAFVVEVKLDALYKSGISPVGQRPNSVSMEKILQCLRDKDKAKVAAGAKVAVRNYEEGQMRSTRKVYIEQGVSKGKKSDDVAVVKKFVPYETCTSFVACANVSPDSSIRLEFMFNQETPEVVSENDRPPNFMTRNWRSIVSLEAGKPSIAGATQNDETAVFLIIVADIENK